MPEHIDFVFCSQNQSSLWAHMPSFSNIQSRLRVTTESESSHRSFSYFVMLKI